MHTLYMLYHKPFLLLFSFSLNGNQKPIEWCKQHTCSCNHSTLPLTSCFSCSLCHFQAPPISAGSFYKLRGLTSFLSKISFLIFLQHFHVDASLKLSSCAAPVFIWFSLHLKEWNLFFEIKLSSSTHSVFSSRIHYSSCLSYNYKYLGSKITSVSLTTFPSLFLEYPAFLRDFVKHARKASST